MIYLYYQIREVIKVGREELNLRLIELQCEIENLVDAIGVLEIYKEYVEGELESLDEEE